MASQIARAFRWNNLETAAGELAAQNRVAGLAALPGPRLIAEDPRERG